MPEVTNFQAAMDGVFAVLVASRSRRDHLRNAIDRIAYGVTKDKDDAKDITNGIMRDLFGISPEESEQSADEQGVLARIAALEEKIKQLTQPLVKETAAGTPTPPFSVGEVLESKQGTIRGSLIVIRVYICDDGEGHPLWFADVVQCATGASYKKVYCDLLQRVGR